MPTIDNASFLLGFRVRYDRAVEDRICIGPGSDVFRRGCFNTSSVHSRLAHSHGVGADPVGFYFLSGLLFSEQGLEGPVKRTCLVRRCSS
jgi:hypothetical protein